MRLGSLYIVPHVYGLIDNCQDSAFAPINLKLPLANVIQWNPKYNLKFFVMFPMNHYCLNKNWLTHWLRKKKLKKGNWSLHFWREIGTRKCFARCRQGTLIHELCYWIKYFTKNRVGAKKRALRGSLPISQQPSEERKSARTQYSGNDVNC